MNKKLFATPSPNILQPKRVNPQDIISPEGMLVDNKILLSKLARDKVLTPKVGSGKKPPVSMAKRNARERNRVKQVNQGFQTLKQHIPDNYRVKKMSKVDTLRCALDYIKSLEVFLGDSPSSPSQISFENNKDHSGLIEEQLAFLRDYSNEFEDMSKSESTSNNSSISSSPQQIFNQNDYTHATTEESLHPSLQTNDEIGNE